MPVCIALFVSLGGAGTAQGEPLLLAGGFRIVSTRSISQAVTNPVGIPPLQGPLTRVPLALTDQRQPAVNDDWIATAHAGLDGNALPGATSNDFVMAILDSGAGTHLVSYTNAVQLGLQGSFLTSDLILIGGIGGTTNVIVSEPVGFFIHGLQDLDGGGALQPGLTFGQANFSCGVNTEENVLNSVEIPTVLGAPFFNYFVVSIHNSQFVRTTIDGTLVSTPEVGIYASASDTNIPLLAHKVFLELKPSSPTPIVAYLPLFGTPSLIEFGSLYFTASDMSMSDGGNNSSGQMVVDTAAQSTLISEIIAAELSLNLLAPDFEVLVAGIVGTTNAPGFYIDSMTIPSDTGPVVWTNVPVIVLNINLPGVGILDGIFGSNLWADRDLVFDGTSTPPFIRISDPIVNPRLVISEMRSTGQGGLEIDWLTEPAPPVLRLESCGDLLADPPDWQTVATGDLATITGTFSITGSVVRQYFRLAAP